ncbi:hypothetical protein B0T17DRAFT_18252 [Bombardia bombarda]|uniref:Secreted protein n=1 Tax=Bombardia bombarda TaxID=252184 RepID=A0AA40CDU4_9PEZI|nr:hypothetical protein B0T17DRAFT_18252 [Bombardia bombarda]
MTWEVDLFIDLLMCIICSALVPGREHGLRRLLPTCWDGTCTEFLAAKELNKLSHRLGTTSSTSIQKKEEKNLRRGDNSGEIPRHRRACPEWWVVMRREEFAVMQEVECRGGKQLVRYARVNKYPASCESTPVGI